jgi:UDP-GlcNAc:undecaprenyl-phosphate GlcNAc-1-phosphate transferase
LFAAVAIVFATGLLDDLLTLQPKQKLLGQVMAAVLVWCSGLHVELFHGAVFDQWLSLPITVFWLLACSNAFNLIDGLDGLCAGAALFGTATMAVAAAMDHNTALLALTLPLAASLVAFLCFNFNPASVFLGDCGSLTLGFLLGCFSLVWVEQAHSVLGFTAPLMAMSLPLLDTTIAIARRFVRNRPIFSPDRGHVHHKVLDFGNSVRKTAIILYTFCAMAGVCGLLASRSSSELRAAIFAAFCGCVLVAVRYLRYAEFASMFHLVAGRVMFRVIDDRVRIGQLHSALDKCRNESEALQLIEKASLELGFSRAVVAESETMASNAHTEMIALIIPLDDDRRLMLEYSGSDHRPIPLATMRDAVQSWFSRRAFSADLFPGADLESDDFAASTVTAPAQSEAA